MVIVTTSPRISEHITCPRIARTHKEIVKLLVKRNLEPESIVHLFKVYGWDYGLDKINLFIEDLE